MAGLTWCVRTSDQNAVQMGAIHGALAGLGFSGVRDVRAGKLIELDLDDGVSREDVDAMCRKLLANTVIENYRIDGGDADA